MAISAYVICNEDVNCEAARAGQQEGN
jgi:hypothetical protein